MHGEIATVDFEKVSKSQLLTFPNSLKAICSFFVLIAIALFFFEIGMGDEKTAQLTWGSYYVSLTFFMGLTLGPIMITAIFQVVRATWVAPVRRIAEANISFLPILYVLLLFTYVGKEYLFPWATSPRAGTEWWMQPDFVYIRIAVMFAFLFVFMARFVFLSISGDLGILRERSAKNKEHSPYFEGIYNFIIGKWINSEIEIPNRQRKLSFLAPILIICYAIIYSFFAFEMVMAIDTKWMSNLFGAFLCIGNVYIGWAVVALCTMYYSKRNKDYAEIAQSGTFWDIGKLTFGFCMLWGYFFFSQFLPQWYGNLPEETQWMILRTREYPWKGWAWFTFACSFIIPFILLLSSELKKTPLAYTLVIFIIFTGVWCEKYTIIMPNYSPDVIPFRITDVILFLGFLGAYILSIQNFITKFPFIPLSHPQTYGHTNW